MSRKAKSRPALSGVATADRTLSVLTAFRRGDDAVELAELASRTGLVKSTIMRLAISLENAGLVIRTVDGRYRLGAEVSRLGMVQQEASNLEDEIRPILEHISETTGETASFWVREGDQRTCLYRVNSKSALRFDVQPGTVRPLDKSSSAQVITAFDEERPPKAPTLPIYSSGAHTAHVSSVAAPVFASGPKLVGALAVSGPSVRLTRPRAKEVAPVLLQAAADLSRSLGGFAGSPYDKRRTSKHVGSGPIDPRGSI